GIFLIYNKSNNFNISKVNVEKNSQGHWLLQVKDKPFIVKGVVYDPVKIGESSENNNLRNWMFYDDNKNNINDVAFESWLDVNKNNKMDSTESIIGDFQLLKEMGVNTILLKHIPSNNSVHKKLFRTLFNKYEIRIIMGHYLGAWLYGSGLPQGSEVDYSNPLHRETIKNSVRAMVKEHKNEPYVLIWMLGNENNVAYWSSTNAYINLQAYAEFVEEVSQMIHELDPLHPVALCDGHLNNFPDIKTYNRFCPSLDIYAINAYMGPNGFSKLWNYVKKEFDRPLLISSFGFHAFDAINNNNSEKNQKEYLKGCWENILFNSVNKGSGNAIGVIINTFLDCCYLDGDPDLHDKGKQKWILSNDGFKHKEWFGIFAQGNNQHSPFQRVPRQAYNYFKKEWNE
ncbi:hypothetical protein BVX93_01940, partial [bacterium B13(2017)]